jgi:nucleotide-binding universal stress UspA family protein
MKIRRMLVATDFSQCSQRALEYAIGLATDLGAKLFLVHAIEPVYFAGAFYGPDASVPMLTEEQRRYAKEAMVDLRDALKRRNVAVADVIIASGPPHQMIVEEAAARKVDLIVVGTHGRGGVAHLLLGSVAEKVVRSAKCPVLTIPGSAETTAQGDKKPARRAAKKKAA